MEEHRIHHDHHAHVPEKDIRIVFVASIALKALNGALETILGLGLLFTSGMTEVIVKLMQAEVVEDPDGFFATHFSRFAAHISATSQLYGAIYLLSHGALKVFLAWGLIKNKLWAYPAALVVFALFAVYQLVSTIRSFSWFMIALTAFDVVVIWLVWHEWRYVTKRRHVPIE